MGEMASSQSARQGKLVLSSSNIEQFENHDSIDLSAICMLHVL